MTPIRIACTAIGKRIVAGRIKKSGLGFQGEPDDVTSDVLKAVIDKIGIGGEHIITVDGKPLFSIKVSNAVEPISGK